MEGEIHNFMMVWALIYVSVCYCYGVSKIIPKGTLRLITFLPVASLFVYLPLNCLHSVLLGAGTSVFISWLGNFKIMMFAFDVGPLADPSLSLAHFVALACLPIKFQKYPQPQLQNPLKKPIKRGPNQESLYPKTSKSGLESPLIYAMKGVSLALLVYAYDYSKYIPPKVVKFLKFLHLCIHVEFLFAIPGALAQLMLRTKVEPQFNNPLLSTSLHDFWSSRWNLIVSDTIRWSIYKPIRLHLRPILGHEWSLFLGVMGSFLVSGLMHELLMYQTGRMRPKWGCTLFFLFHGLCLVVEIVLKKIAGPFQLPPLISRLLSLALVIGTFSRVIVTELLQVQVIERMIEEYVAVGTFMKDIVSLCTRNRLFRHVFV